MKISKLPTNMDFISPLYRSEDLDVRPQRIMMKAILLILIMLPAFHANCFVPTEALTFDFNIKTVQMHRTHEEKLQRAVELLREVFASPEFRKRILKHRYQGRLGFYLNRGLSNIDIYHLILNGTERLYPISNNAMDVEIELYADFESRVLGFTLPRSKRIWMNKKYFLKFSSAEIAANLTHEWLHKLGFDHEKERTGMRLYSVPYAIGYIVKELAQDLD